MPPSSAVAGFASHLIPRCQSVLHTKQYCLVHSGHTSLRFAASQAKMKVHPGEGQQDRPSAVERSTNFDSARA